MLAGAALSYVLQGHSVFREMTVAENVLLGADTVSERAVVGEHVEFARSLMVAANVALLDEPSMGLDPKTTGKVFEQVVRMRDAGTAVLLVEQNARRALETADIGCVLDLGRVHASVAAHELLADPQLGELHLGGRPGDGARP